MTDCGEPATLTREQLDNIASYATAALPGGDAVLIAAVDFGENVVACVRSGGQWTAYQTAENGGVEAVYRSEQGDIFAWAYQGRGDPPFAFAAIHLPASGSDRFCTSFDVPEVLNEGGWRGEAFGFGSFNVASDGSGAIIGSSDVERDGKTVGLTFRYDTADGGRTWADPVEVEEGAGVEGLYSRVEEQDEVLLDELRNSLM